MRPCPAQATRLGPKGAGPFDPPSVVSPADASEVDKLPTGWGKRRSGLVVPPLNRPRRRGPAILGFVIAVVLLASPVATAVSDLSRAAVDLITFVRVMLNDDPG